MLEEYETSEIAEELNISKSRVYKAKKAISIKLKKKLEL
jgi:DNA-directed RNA polymerase specialized sigma subunit